MLIGHEDRWRAVARGFAKGRIPQTLLISGPPNVGKTQFVWRYAKLLLCPQTESDADGLPMPCGVCRTCHQVDIETFPDFRVFRPVISAGEPTRAPELLDSSVFRVEQSREASEEVLRRPISGPRKVLVLAQFDRAGDAAENALLKTLEEPPPSTHLVLTTDNARNLRPTILSRCWHLQLAPTRDADIFSWLAGEFPDAVPADLGKAILAAGGRPGAAKRELERLIERDDAAPSRAEVALGFIDRLDNYSPVGALGLTEEALKIAKIWWDEDTGEDGDSKKLGAKGSRAAIARFLDELSLAGRARWMGKGARIEERHAARLDAMRATRGFILRNAGTNLALDVMFGRLIALREGEAQTQSAR